MGDRHPSSLSGSIVQTGIQGAYLLSAISHPLPYFFRRTIVSSRLGGTPAVMA